MALEKLSEHQELPLSTLLNKFDRLIRQMLQPSLLTKLVDDQKIPNLQDSDFVLQDDFLKKIADLDKANKLQEYKIDIREDFLELNQYFGELLAADDAARSKIIKTLAPLLLAINRADYSHQIVKNFFFNLLPERSVIHDYWNGER